MIQEALWILRRIVKKAYIQVSNWRNDVGAWRRFWSSYWRYRKIALKDETPLLPLLRNLYPCIGEDTEETHIEPIYFYQDAWAFEKIVYQKPELHVDVGSHHKFVALLSKVLPVTMVDIRPLSLPLDTISFKQGSILKLPFEDESLESISSLCVIEHIGLGRYGDPLDSEGTEKAIAELKRVVKPKGNLYLSLTIDDENKVFFNAHRTFTEESLLFLFNPFEVVEKRYIYGNQYLGNRRDGFGVGLYHLRR